MLFHFNELLIEISMKCTTCKLNIRTKILIIIMQSTEIIIIIILIASLLNIFLIEFFVLVLLLLLLFRKTPNKPKQIDFLIVKILLKNSKHNHGCAPFANSNKNLITKNVNHSQCWTADNPLTAFDFCFFFHFSFFF